MSQSTIEGFRIAGVATCVPPRVVDNLSDNLGFDAGEVRKVVQMAGVRERRVVEPGVTSADLCYEAAERLLERLGWERDSISALVFVTQSPDYWLPSTSCVVQHWLGLSDECAAFDVGLGCSGYPYGVYIAAAMLRAGGHRRVLMLHGETPSRLREPRGPCDDAAVRRRRIGDRPGTVGRRHRALLPAHRRQRVRRPDHPRSRVPRPAPGGSAPQLPADGRRRHLQLHPRARAAADSFGACAVGANGRSDRRVSCSTSRTASS